MSTTIRPELSRQNPYWISRHRFYELRHFCRQYSEWNNAADSLLRCGNKFALSDNFGKNSGISDPTVQNVIRREEYIDRMDMVEKAAKTASPDLWIYLFKGVTDGFSYEHLVARMQIPCCKETYYEAYRRFFWILSKMRK